MGERGGPRSGAPEYERVLTPFPMVRKLERTLEHDYVGPAYLWDIDKTWLDTRFSQVRGMLRIPFEFAVDKRALPGTTALLHALRQGPSGREHRPLFFITASPPFIRRAIERKMLLDGVEFDGITYKDQVEVARRRHFDSLREHTPFKLGALLLHARAFPAGTTMHLFGDDAERDALIYSLFADICAGRLRGRELIAVVVAMHARRHYAEAVAELAEGLEPRERVAGIYINLVREPDGARLADFDERVLGYPSAGAIAELLRTRGLIGARERSRVEGEGEVVPGARERDPEGWWTPLAARQPATPA